jgi:mRNA-degrading endonuclease RelE of RelBE toxin-antitoxin system
MPDCQSVRALVNNKYGFRLRVGNFRVLFDYDGGIKIVEIQEGKKRDASTY